jgi:hypothetical protein
MNQDDVNSQASGNKGGQLNLDEGAINDEEMINGGITV